MKQIILLDLNPNASPGTMQVHYLLWLTAPTPVIANPTAISAFKTASAGEIASIQAGQIVEESYFKEFPSSLTAAQIKVFLNAHYITRQAYWSSIPAPGAVYGVFFDSSTGWSA